MNHFRLFPILEAWAGHGYGRSHTLKAIPPKRTLEKHMEMPPAPSPRGLVVPKFFPEEEIELEAKRLFEAIGQSSRWNMRICRSISPLTLEINHLKKQKDVFLIAHSIKPQTLSTALLILYPIVTLCLKQHGMLPRGPFSSLV